MEEEGPWMDATVDGRERCEDLFEGIRGWHGTCLPSYAVAGRRWSYCSPLDLAFLAFTARSDLSSAKRRLCSTYGGIHIKP